ncbi:hypothetical protein YPPY88_2014 [Yersinia pestis PY-88]|nr:hypothetical protein YPPY88_2014 [Yersinia pestis PY-88]
MYDEIDRLFLVNWVVSADTESVRAWELSCWVAGKFIDR